MEWVVGIADGYGDLDNATEILNMEELEDEGKCTCQKVVARRP